MFVAVLGEMTEIFCKYVGEIFFILHLFVKTVFRFCPDINRSSYISLEDADPSDFPPASVNISILTLLSHLKLKYTSSGRHKSDYFTHLI